MIRQIRLGKNNFQKIQNSKIILKQPKTKNQRRSWNKNVENKKVQAYYMSTEQMSKNLKTHKLSYYTPKDQKIKEGVL